MAFFTKTLICIALSITVLSGCSPKDSSPDTAESGQPPIDQNITAAQLFDQANALCLQGEYQQTIVTCSKAIEMNPEFANAYSLRGRAYAYLGNYNRAIADFDMTLKHNPDYILAHFFMGNAYAESGNIRGAIDAYKAFLQRPEPDFSYLQQQAQEKIQELENKI